MSFSTLREYLLISYKNFRAAYICQSENKRDWQKYLLKIGLGEDEVKNIFYRANALNCFIIISDVPTVEELTHISFDEFQ